MTAALIAAIAALVTSVVNGIALIFHINNTTPPAHTEVTHNESA
jgi:hypothetical protein